MRSRGIVLALLTLIGVLLTASLGAWQLDRAAQKRSLQQSLTERAQMPLLALADLPGSGSLEPWLHRRLSLRGHWQNERSVYLDNRTMDGRVGFFVLTPFLLQGRTDAVLVQRGWLPRDAMDRTRLAALPVAGGEQRIDGLIAATPSRLFELGRSEGGLIRQNLAVAGFSQEIGVALQPFVLLQTGSDVSDGLARHWSAPAVDIHKHYGYAFQWFALSALQLGLYVWFQVIRPRRTCRA